MYSSYTRMPGFLLSFWKPNDDWLIDWTDGLNLFESYLESIDATANGPFKVAPWYRCLKQAQPEVQPWVQAGIEGLTKLDFWQSQPQVYFILDELILGGEISETARKSILDNLQRVDKMDWAQGEDTHQKKNSRNQSE